ncbi:MAG: DNA repair protein RecO [Bdellovibrionales bacterium RIFCSPHIGHO2_01_FULL_40_29]|nr:MAG: DNA repair protein RecO [Bdellovibrionales bacterium RIFCSPHIGHO2_01_FULL_40_29]OFZ33948.1 MAG: DNA repair protein RecO [Bdellovibrionales bacterium RIFCSPHIGHO2_02_FULL_40_15]
MSEKQDRFIILKCIKYGESDLILHALSSQGAKYSFLARGALKSKKRFGGGILQPSHFVSLTFKDTSEEGKLRILNEATLIDDFKSIRTDYERLDFALFALNCAGSVSQAGDVHSDFLFNLLGNTLRTAGVAENLTALKLHFCLKFLFQQGVVSIEEWMSPFLRINIMDHATLLMDNSVQSHVDNYLDSIESLVMQYIKTADPGF